MVEYEGEPPSRKNPYPIDHEYDTVDGAVYWIAHMKATKKKFSGQDAKDLARAFSEILECPGLANAYPTTHATKAESKKKVMSDSGSACGKCNERFRCFTLDNWAI